jgi:multisubunit Na+/H+ antiporter MnhB subunit
MNVGIQRMLMIAVSVVFMVHLMACMYFLVGKFEDEDEFNWAIYAGIGDSPDEYQYIVSVYWALQTLTTVGYGDLPARSVYEKIAAVIWMIIGVGFYSFTIGNLSSIFNSIDVKGAHL